jgi:aerobic-type carbon monoxide dehydrogenase small subunit (CoxS/CutS family)
MTTITLHVNGRDEAVDVAEGTPLLWVLRDTIGLTGAKYGCGMGACGTCTVLVDGRPARACVTPVESVGGADILTIEGLSADGSHAVQRAWLELDVAQCGYCQPGQILSAVALLADQPQPDDAAIDAAMSGILCRCGTYQRIRAAIHRAAELGGAS